MGHEFAILPHDRMIDTGASAVDDGFSATGHDGDLVVTLLKVTITLLHVDGDGHVHRLSNIREGDSLLLGRHGRDDDSWNRVVVVTLASLLRQAFVGTASHEQCQTESETHAIEFDLARFHGHPFPAMAVLSLGLIVAAGCLSLACFVLS